MIGNIAAAAVGLLFSLGLGLSGMTDPQKVLDFLDVFGSWDPSLAFVMAGALAVHLTLYPAIRRRSAPLLSPQFRVPQNRQLTGSLVFGSLIFGIGWGLAGYCPGPGLVSLVTLEARPLLFGGGLAMGMLLFFTLNRWRRGTGS